MALYALVLRGYAPEGCDCERAARMALVHDLVEIDAGDTYAYDAKGYEDKAQRESAAADRIFGMLPEELGAELRGLWEEFEAGQTPTARYACALRPHTAAAAELSVGRAVVDQARHSRLAGAGAQPDRVRHTARAGAIIRALISDAVKRGWLIDG